MSKSNFKQKFKNTLFEEFKDYVAIEDQRSSQVDSQETVTPIKPTPAKDSEFSKTKENTNYADFDEIWRDKIEKPDLKSDLTLHDTQLNQSHEIHKKTQIENDYQPKNVQNSDFHSFIQLPTSASYEQKNYPKNLTFATEIKQTELIKPKKRNRLAKVAVFFVILTLLVTAGTGAFLYSQNKKRFNDLKKTCQKDIEKAEAYGLDMQSLDCKVEDNIQNYFNPERFQQKIKKNQENIKDQTQELQNQLTSLNREIQENEAKLSELSIKNSLSRPSMGINLTKNLEQQKVYLQQLQELIGTESPKIDQKINETLQNYRRLVNTVNTLDLKAETDFLSNYQVLAVPEKVAKYGELQTALQKLEEKIKTQKSATYWQEISDFVYVDKTSINQILKKQEWANTTPLKTKISITGNVEVDAKIFNLAAQNEQINYPIAAPNNLTTLSNKSRVQNQVAIEFDKMANTARSQRASFAVLSGYKDVKTQTNEFLKEFEKKSIATNQKKFSNQEILESKADVALKETFQNFAPPGMRVSQTGYLVAIQDINKKDNFFGSNSYKWLSDDNFLNAKRYGFMPAYIPDPNSLSPNFKLIYVGPEALKN